jgi:dipeptidyl aminopeptidase/acylaminoacyl peptidase
MLRRIAPIRAVLVLTFALLPADVLAFQAPADGAEVVAPAGGKVLTLEDYAGWKRIGSAGLSPDGRWMSYAYSPNEGDDTLFIRQLDGNTVHSVVRGTGPSFSGDSRWITYTITPPESNGRRGGGAGGRGQAPPGRAGGAAQGGDGTRTFVLLDLQTGTKHEITNVTSSAFSLDARWLIAHRNRADREAEHQGADLVLRNLGDGTVRNIGNVASYSLNETGQLLAWTVDAADDVGNGVYVMDLAGGATRTLDAAAETYSSLEWNESGTGLVALRGTTPDEQVHRANVLLAFTGLSGRTNTIVYDPSQDASFPQGFVISDLTGANWTEDGERIMLGIREQQAELEDPETPRPDVEVWHWKDTDVQSIQKVREQQLRRFTYASVFNLDDRKFIRLADDDMRTVTPVDNSRYAIGRVDSQYRYELSWGGSRADYYRVDLETGERELMVPALRRQMGTSPDGKWFLYLKDEKLQVRNIESGRTADLSALAGVSFVNVDDDHDYELPAWGLGGWSADGKHVIVNHRFDLWMLPLEGGSAVNLTKGMGDTEQIRFRVANTGGGRGGRGGGGADQGIETSKPIRLSAYGERTKKSGYYEVGVGDAPEPVLYEDMSIGSLEKADSADRVIFTKQTFEEFPDYWVASTDLEDARKVTDANPQIDEFAWGRRILIDYTDARGNQLQATLAFPANYEPGRRYPMLVYFYEKMSQNHNVFSMPTYDDRPHMSTYASDGYLVLQPDIVYEIGKPGTSALDDVGSAVRKVIELGYADPERIGLQGHSWGGYQSSYMVTQTDLFAAVVTGAPVTNLVSFYNELYKSSGTVQQGIMEIGQVRMGEGATPWSAHELYESQSPLHNAENITTPFMILHGTADGAVDYHQGLEFFNAAKRLGKEVILLTYNDEPHHLAQKENQIDFQIRMKQFFDHYLKGEPMPRWMAEGVPYIERERVGTGK